MNKLITQEPWIYVDITSPTKDEIESYYKNTGEMKISDSSPEAPRIFKKAKILYTFDETKYPAGSEWMMGEVPGMKINYFGVQYIAIQKKDLYARLDVV